MSDNVTQKDLGALRQDIEEQLQKQTEEIVGVIQSLAFSVQNEFTEIKEQVKDNTDAIDRLATTLDGFASRIENTEVEQAASDARFEKLLSWAKDVSKRTGIPLKDL